MSTRSATVALTIGLTVFAAQGPGVMAQGLPPVPLDHESTQLIDIRGVGDAGMARTYKQPLKLTDRLPEGVTANFGARLDALDRTGQSYRGDLSFINWETVVGTSCRRFRGRPSRSSYTFVSHPDHLKLANDRGFNLVGLANNHSNDCPGGASGRGNGAAESAKHMAALGPKLSNEWLWHGVGPNKTKPMVKTMSIKGQQIKVAFASLYMGGYCNNITCGRDKGKLLQAMRDVDADLRILSIHSWNSATQQQLVKTGSDFIRYFKGDVVFGHGPHVWKPVSVLPSNSGPGRKGVMFQSLGNFIHPSLAAKRRDMIGRVLIDPKTLKVKQVQAIPLHVNGPLAKFSGALPPNQIRANFTWQPIRNPAAWRGNVDPAVKGVYYNVR